MTTRFVTDKRDDHRSLGDCTEGDDEQTVGDNEQTVGGNKVTEGDLDCGRHSGRHSGR